MCGHEGRPGEQGETPVGVDYATDGEIVEALEKLVSDDVTPGTFVILEADPARGHDIQFAIQGDRLFCEAVSNQYLEQQHQLGEDQLRALENPWLAGTGTRGTELVSHLPACRPG